MDGEPANTAKPSVLAVVAGTPLRELPGDLFIPPDALEVLLESFSGPLDLLLYLIRKQNIDVLDIPMTHITEQYMQYIALMEQKRLELAADYLAMAAMLAEIKSRMLLPMPVSSNDEDAEEDPRMALVRRLQAYEQFREAADYLDELPRCERDVYPIVLPYDVVAIKRPLPDVSLSTLLEMMQALCKRQSHLVHHQITRETLSVRDRMHRVLQLLHENMFCEFSALYHYQEGRMGVVVSLLAVLELSRQSLLIITQAKLFSPIYIKGNDHES
ncbi:segregation and condensation protein A [Legionella impletisoli]|uniref:Segregation and condensation protein A n=1 Tax=Legionella impletisoli TaxID=343510 RepID=A0A917JKU3_9GAMM|nr:ScpA family protein [Legionella impletisoli]GGI75367.1 segregation and condensation protein A [Legionella impletisoli]